MNEQLLIRPERAEDYVQTEHMTLRAFWNIHGPGCNEHLLVRKIRTSPDFLPELSRVAELNGRIIGAIYYTKARVVEGEKTHEILTFGPLAVEPTCQNTGVGSRLLKETLRLAQIAGYSGVAIYGEPHYYPRHGFVNCRQFGITTPDGKNFDALMAFPLDADKFSQVHGRLYESAVFEECEDAAELAAATADFPSYPRIKIQEGFLQLYGGRFGWVHAVKDDLYTISYWEQELPAAASAGLSRKPQAGDVVIFDYHAEGLSVITRVCENMI